MKKIEEAAERKYDAFPWAKQRSAFKEGAQHVLDAMITEESGRRLVEALIMKAGTDWAKANAGLSAVRKEIEGE